MTDRPISINGRFLGRPVSGVERYGREILAAWDRLLLADPALPRPRVLVPAGVEAEAGLSAIRIEPVGRLGGHAWEQVELALASRGDVLVSLANAGPVLHPRHLAVIHDAAVFRFPESYGRSYRLFHQTLGRALARTARLATVSAFSRDELAHFLRIAPERIAVAGNGSEHFAQIGRDDSALDALGLRDRRFILAVGTLNQRKNLDTAIEAWRRGGFGPARLVIVGHTNDRVFAARSVDAVEGVILAGRLSDAALKGLFGAASALVFPSRYEGFGIPPLEAMVNGCPVIASTIPPVREICGEDAAYFDPDDVEALIALLRAQLASGRGGPDEAARLQSRAARASWQASAAMLAAIAGDLARSRQTGERR